MIRLSLLVTEDKGGATRPSTPVPPNTPTSMTEQYQGKMLRESPYSDDGVSFSNLHAAEDMYVTSLCDP